METTRKYRDNHAHIVQLSMANTSSAGTVSNNNEKGSRSNSSPENYRAYHWRWLLLFVLCVLSVSNGTLWLTFSPIPNDCASFYRISMDNVDWFSNSYFTASLIMGFFSIWVLDTYQLRVAIIIGAVLNFTGAVIRYVSTFHVIICSSQFPLAGFGIAMLGQVLTAFAQPFFLYAPTKLANTWFKPSERSICTGIATLANTLGVAIVQVISPEVVKNSTDLPTLLWILIIPAGIGGVLSLTYIHSKPPIPPAPSGNVWQEPFFKGLKLAMTNMNFLVLMIVWGVAAGGFCTLLIIFPQYLCPSGYTDLEVGTWVALLSVCGMIGATVFGLITDRTKLFKEVGVVVYTFASLIISIFIIIAGYPNLHVPMAITLCLFGVFGLGLLPICLELGVEVTYPVAEATSTGLLWSFAQFIGMIMLLVGSLLLARNEPPVNEYNRCGLERFNANTTIVPICEGQDVFQVPKSLDDPLDWTYGGIFIVLLMLLGYFVFVVMFKPDYKRTNFEEKMKLKINDGDCTD